MFAEKGSDDYYEYLAEKMTEEDRQKAIQKKKTTCPFGKIYKDYDDWSLEQMFDIFINYIKALETKDRKIIKKFKDDFFMEYHRTKYKYYRFSDGEMAFYLFTPLLWDEGFFHDLWFKDEFGKNFGKKPDFKSFPTKRSFITYFSDYTYEDLLSDRKKLDTDTPDL